MGEICRSKPFKTDATAHLISVYEPNELPGISGFEWMRIVSMMLYDLIVVTPRLGTSRLQWALLRHGQSSDGAPPFSEALNRLLEVAYRLRGTPKFILCPEHTTGERIVQHSTQEAHQIACAIHPTIRELARDIWQREVSVEDIFHDAIVVAMLSNWHCFDGHTERISPSAPAWINRARAIVSKEREKVQLVAGHPDAAIELI